MRHTWIISLSFACAWLYVPALVYAEATQQQLDALEQNYEEQQEEIKTLKRELEQQRKGVFSSAIARFNPKIALNGLFTAAGFSDDESLNFGGHDPKENGFNAQAMD